MFVSDHIITIFRYEKWAEYVVPHIFSIGVSFPVNFEYPGRTHPIGSDTIRQFPIIGSDGIPTVGNLYYPLISDEIRRRILSDSGDRIRWDLIVENCRIRRNPMRSDNRKPSDTMTWKHLILSILIFRMYMKYILNIIYDKGKPFWPR
jgi:hypothetical protein